MFKEKMLHERGIAVSRRRERSLKILPKEPLLTIACLSTDTESPPDRPGRIFN